MPRAKVPLQTSRIIPKFCDVSSIPNLKGQDNGLLDSNLVQGRLTFLEAKAHMEGIKGKDKGMKERRGKVKKRSIHSVLC